MDYFFYILMGILAGVLAGLLGLGGGVVMVPGLMALFSWQHFPHQHIMHLATATSLAAVMLTAVISVLIHHRHGSVKWSLLRYLIPGTIIGAVLGVIIAHFLPTSILQIIFAIFCFFLALKIFFQAHQSSIIKQPPTTRQLFLLSLVAGALAGLLGLGGGILMVPLLLWLGLSMPETSATSAACILPTALSGTLTAIVFGSQLNGLPSHSWGLVYWPAALLLGVGSALGAPFGVYLVHRLPTPRIKQLFALILVVIAWRMLPL